MLSVPRTISHLVVREDAGDDDDSCQDNAEVQVVVGRLLHGRGLDEVCDKAKNGAKPEQHCEPT